MTHLEDFLDKLKHLPQEFRKRTSEIEQLDLKATNSMNIVKQNVNTLFSTANDMEPDEVDSDFETIMKIGHQALKHSDEKIQIADSLQKLMTRYINHLDIGLEKYRADLKIDKKNVTEKFEKKIDKFSNSSIMKESIVTDSNSSSRDGFNLLLDTILTETEMDQFPSDSLEHMEADNSVILAAESKVSKKSVKRLKSANLKASTTASTTTSTTVSTTSTTSTSAADEKTSTMTCAILPESPISNKVLCSDSTKINRAKKHSINSKRKKTDVVATINDSDKRLYCLCNEVAYGKMIGCDNSKCRYEWFHYECVAIESEPKHEKWYCPMCVVKLKRKRC
ncbi:unnamed protein product [Aphis gossypii]|uniref:Inhibitor of growth protein n=1 Tax=Aphis gossypii TaxID=80765 RepID=A0A9P0J572_APHGO|nr:unnamed protein product [Aphis gossypii]